MVSRNELIAILTAVRETILSMSVDSTTWDIKRGQLHALMYAAGQLVDWTDQSAYQWVDSIHQRKRLGMEITPRREVNREADGDLIWA